MEYKSIADELPDANKPLMTYNGETEVKNIYDGEKFKYALKYPWTHWRYREKVPSQQEVELVRQQMCN